MMAGISTVGGGASEQKVAVSAVSAGEAGASSVAYSAAIGQVTLAVTKKKILIIADGLVYSRTTQFPKCRYALFRDGAIIAGTEKIFEVQMSTGAYNADFSQYPASRSFIYENETPGNHNYDIRIRNETNSVNNNNALKEVVVKAMEVA